MRIFTTLGTVSRAITLSATTVVPFLFAPAIAFGDPPIGQSPVKQSSASPESRNLDYWLYINTYHTYYTKANTWDDLPKLKAKDGTPILDSAGRQIVDTSLMRDPGTLTSRPNGPWAMACQRDPSGDLSINIDRGAYWFPGIGTEWMDHWQGVITAPTWIGDGNFGCALGGFEQPSYSWKLTGGSPSGNAAAELQKSGEARSNYFPYYVILGRDSVAPIYLPLFGEYEVDGIDLGGREDGEFMVKSSTLEARVGEDSIERPIVDLTNKVTITWHVPYEVVATKHMNTFWTDVNPESLRIDQCGWQGQVEGVWKWKTLHAGQVDGVEDYWRDGYIQAWHLVDNLVGVTEASTNGIDAAIDNLPDPRQKIIMKLGKKAFELATDKFVEQKGTPSSPESAGFRETWQLNSTKGNPYCTWKDGIDGIETNMPPLSIIYPDWDNLTSAQLQEIGKWRLTDPVHHAEFDSKLTRFDDYDDYGYSGYSYLATENYSGNSRITGTFVRQSPSNPDNEPNEP